MKKPTHGIHLLLDWYGCDQDITNNARLLEHHLLEAARIAGCKVLHSYCYQFSPQGSTAIVVLAESHISAHSEPEHDYISIDIFTCMESMMPYQALDYLQEILKPTNPKITEQYRH